MKKVLIIAYHYPPSVAAGAVRPAKFAKYLGEFGWQATVLTVADRIGRSPGEVSKCETVGEWPHPLKYYERFRMRKVPTNGHQNELIADKAAPHALAMNPPTRGIVGLKRWLMAFLWLPDQEVGWLIPAVWRALWLVRQRNITHMITTGPPFTCHLIGLALKRLTGLHWVADFRDPWSLVHKLPILRNNLTDRIEKQLIQAVMKRADRIMCVTLPMTEQARKEFPYLPAEKFVTLTNGFDVDDFKGLTRDKQTAGTVEISYLGTFYFGRSPEPLLRALQSLIKEGRLREESVRVNFIGNVARAEGRSVREMITAFGLEGIVAVSPPISRSEALKRVLSSHIILVLDEHHPVQIPMKLYEALAVGAIIINIGSEGATAEIVRNTQRGRVTLYTNQEDIKRALLECVEKARSERPENAEPWNDLAIQEFNIKHLTRSLAELLNALDGRSGESLI